MTSTAMHFAILLYVLCAILFTIMGLELKNSNRFMVKTVALFCFMEALHNALFAAYFIFNGLPMNGWIVFMFQSPIFVGLIAIWVGIFKSDGRYNGKEN